MSSLQLVSYSIRIDGTPLPQAARGDLTAIEVHEEVDVPTMFTLRLNNWDGRSVTWSDSKLFTIGARVDIAFTTVRDVRMSSLKDTLIEGEITGLEPEFEAGKTPMLTVRGYDRRFRLLRGRNTRSFVNVKDSDIVRTIVQPLGLLTKAHDSQVVLEYVLQHNQTDLEFLQRRARQINYELVLNNRTLHFRPRVEGKIAALKLHRDRELLTFSPRLSVAGQVGQMLVKGWDPKHKEPLLGQTRQVAGMGSVQTGPRVASAVFGDSSESSVAEPVDSQDEARQLAQGQLDALALAYISGSGTCIGNDRLRAGALVLLEGLGQRFSGTYYVTAATHTYTPEEGYRTAFEVRRNAS